MGFGTNPQYGFERPVVIQMEMLGRQLVCKPGVGGEQGVGGGRGVSARNNNLGVKYKRSLILCILVRVHQRNRANSMQRERGKQIGPQDCGGWQVPNLQDRPTGWK